MRIQRLIPIVVVLFIVAATTMTTVQHRYRQVVDAEVTEVLKCVGGGRHSRTAQASYDYDVGSHMCIYAADFTDERADYQITKKTRQRIAKIG